MQLRKVSPVWKRIKFWTTFHKLYSRFASICWQIWSARLKHAQKRLWLTSTACTGNATLSSIQKIFSKTWRWLWEHAMHLLAACSETLLAYQHCMQSQCNLQSTPQYSPEPSSQCDTKSLVQSSSLLPSPESSPKATLKISKKSSGPQSTSKS